MKKLIILLTALMLVSCGVDNDKRIQEFKKCKDAGMEAVVGAFGDIICSPYTK